MIIDSLDAISATAQQMNSFDPRVVEIQTHLQKWLKGVET